MMHIMISPVVIFLAVLVQPSSTVAVTKPAESKEPQKALNKTLDWSAKAIPILTDILCAACSKINNTNENNDCRKKYCTTAATARKSHENIIIEEAFKKQVMDMLSDKERSDAKTLISAVRDMICKLCGDIKNTAESNDCRQKNCPVSKPSVISVNLGTEKLSSIS